MGVGAAAVLVLAFAVTRSRQPKNKVASGAHSEDGLVEKSAADESLTRRPIVSFENPMYKEESEQNGSSGLYDQPMFTGDQQKSNPVYEDTEGGNESSPTTGTHEVPEDAVQDDTDYLDVEGRAD